MLKLAGRIEKLVIAALMALAVSLAWLPVGASALDHRTHMHGTGNEHAQASPTHHGSDDDRMAATQHSCDTCGIDCCTSAHCYPGLATEARGILFVAPADMTNAAFGADAFGNAPDVAVPPPRILLI